MFKARESIWNSRDKILLKLMRFTIVVARHYRCWSNFSSSSSSFLSLSLVFRLYFVRIMFDESKSRPDQTWSRLDKSNKLILLIDWQQSSIHSNNLFMLWQPACLSKRMQFSMLALDCRSRTTERGSLIRLRSKILAWFYFLFLCHSSLSLPIRSKLSRTGSTNSSDCWKKTQNVCTT